MNNNETKLTDNNKGKYLDKLNKVMQFTPKDKLNDLEKLIDIVKKH